MGKEDILVSVKATALNRADLLQKIGKYPPPPGESTVLGLEIDGVVEAVGSAVKHWSIGDRVCALLPGGGHAAKGKSAGWSGNGNSRERSRPWCQGGNAQAPDRCKWCLLLVPLLQTWQVFITVLHL